MIILWGVIFAVSLVHSATYDYEWDARELQYTCNGLQEQSGKGEFSNVLIALIGELKKILQN